MYLFVRLFVGKVQCYASGTKRRQRIAIAPNDAHLGYTSGQMFHGAHVSRHQAVYDDDRPVRFAAILRVVAHGRQSFRNAVAPSQTTIACRYSKQRQWKLIYGRKTIDSPSGQWVRRVRRVGQGKLASFCPPNRERQVRTRRSTGRFVSPQNVQTKLNRRHVPTRYNSNYCRVKTDCDQWRLTTKYPNGYLIAKLTVRGVRSLNKTTLSLFSYHVITEAETCW